jgi:hypothetical protein
MSTIGLLMNFARTRPGFEYANYGDVGLYRSDVRRATRQLADARYLGRYCELFDITPDFSAFGGRLQLDGGKLYYCTGQYYPTEYRAAVCAVLASGIWYYWRDCGYTADQMRRKAREEFGAGIARRWFA